jgi:hypothetical protein
MEQQLADRPVPSFSREFIAALASEDIAGAVPRLPAGSARGCAPITLPIRAMLREKIFRIDGVIAATIFPSGLVGEVVATNVVPVVMAADVETLFATALRTEPCRFPASKIIKRIEIPFTLKLD